MFNRREYNKIWRLKNPNKVKSYNVKAREKIKDSPEKLEKNRRLARERYSKYRYSKLERAREYSKTPPSLFSRTRINAKKRNLRFDISLDEFVTITNLPCSYCGDTEIRHGIDRVDNDEGYIKDNSVSCCKPCNYMKNKSSLQEFKDHIEKVYKKICLKSL